MAGWGSKNWFVTGASSGFGQAIAAKVVEAGGKVIATARNPETLAQLVALAPERVLPVALDIRDREQMMQALAQADAFGGIDVLVNNAGYGFLGGIEESGEDEIEAQLDVNLLGPLRLIRAVAPALRARGSGYVVNISSVAGVRAFAGAGFYSASKFALEALSEALDGELERFGTRVLIVEPGYFRTDFSGRSLAAPADPHPEYGFLARQRENARAANGMQIGDPFRGADAIIAAMDSETAPRRLVLGSDAYKFVKTALDSRLAELEQWRTLTQSTDFPEEGQA